MNQELTAIVPLESDPDVFTNFARSLGLKSAYSFIDIYSISDETLLSFIQRPVVAIVLLMPVSSARRRLPVPAIPERHRDRPIWLQQKFTNACGLYALLHILSNFQNLLCTGSKLSNFIERCRHEQREKATDLSTEINAELDQFIVDFVREYPDDFLNASGTATAAPKPEDVVDLHYITFISHDKALWELDGRASVGGPIYLGESTQQLEGEYMDIINEPIVKRRIESYMESVESEVDKLKFSLIGLARTNE